MPDTSKYIYLSGYPSDQAVEVKENLYKLYKSSDKLHKLTDSPESADMILIGQPGNERNRSDYIREIKENRLLETYPEKCFAVSFFRANHIFLTRGVYESGIKSLYLNKRVASGCYVPCSFNPVIEETIRNEQVTTSAEKKYLFSFVGRDSHKIRKKLFSIKFKRDDILIEDSSEFNVWDESINQNHWRFGYYKDVIEKSKFSLCPRGYGPGSIRLFESMSLGISPVIISDEWKLPYGPDWENFSIIIHSRDLHKLEKIVSGYEERHEIMGRKAKEAYNTFFSEDNYFNYIVSECERIQSSSALPEKYHWKLRFLYIRYYLIMYWISSKSKKMKRYFFLILSKIKK